MRKLLTLMAILSFFILAEPAKAFSISPVKFKITIDPGTKQVLALKVKNDEKTDQLFDLAIIGARQDELGRPIFAKDMEIAENWIHLESGQKFLVPAGKEKAFSFIIEVPKGTSPGAHYLGLSAEKKDSIAGGVHEKLISLLIMQVSGLANESLEVEEWSGKMINWDNSWPFNLRLRNNGNIDIPLVGVIEVKNWLGQVKPSFKIDLGNNLLANSIRANSPILRENLLLPGLYEVTAKIAYGRTGQLIVVNTQIWYLPIWFFLSVIILVIILFLAVIIRKKRKV